MLCDARLRWELFPSERAVKETLALRIYAEVTEEQAHYFVEGIHEFFSAAADRADSAVAAHA